MGVSTTAGATTTDRIRRIHGNAVANELLPFEVSDDYLGFKAKGMLSNANYHVKKTTLLLFINSDLTPLDYRPKQGTGSNFPDRSLRRFFFHQERD